MSVRDLFESLDYGPAPDAAEAARAWLGRHDGRFGHAIAGSLEPPGGDILESHDPASGEPLAVCTLGDAADVERAARAARASLPEWRELPGLERARHLRALAQHLRRHAALLAQLETLEAGAPIRETRVGVALAARHFDHHAALASQLEREFPGNKSLGVCAPIVARSAPLLTLARRVAPALAAGCTLVLKPSEHASFSALALAELATAAGLPPGVLNVVTGDGRTGAALIEHEDIDGVAFTGSVAVGRLIRERSAGRGLRLMLELGSARPFIVFDDADLDAAVEGVVDAAWSGRPQAAGAGTQLLLHEPIEAEFIRRLRARMETLRLGPPLDGGVDLGPLTGPAEVERAQGLVRSGVDEGATSYQPSRGLPGGGAFFPPTLLVGVEPAMTVAREAPTAPLVLETSFRTPDEAVEIANHTPLGFAASVWSERLALALDVASRLQAQVVWVNAVDLVDAAVGSGGARSSGFGSAGGREALRTYLVDAVERVQGSYPERPEPEAGGAGGRVSAVDSGGRKDVRDAVEAARKAGAWSRSSGQTRAQALYRLSELLGADLERFAGRLRDLTGADEPSARREVELSVQRLFAYAGYAETQAGAVPPVPARALALELRAPWGVVGVSAPDEAPLLAFVSLVAPLLALGNRVVATPSPRWPQPASDFAKLAAASELPSGVLRLVTGERDALARVLADHDEVACHWYVGSAEGSADVERRAAGNLKATWVNHGRRRDWFDPAQGEGDAFVQRAAPHKSIWLPYGA